MHRNRILVFSAATFLYWAALFIYLPTLPAYVKERAPSLAAVGVVLSMFGLWEAILRVPLGILVDATGRRWIGGVLADAMGIRSMFLVVAAFCFLTSNVLILFHPRRGTPLATRRLQTTTASDTLAADDQVHLRP